MMMKIGDKIWSNGDELTVTKLPYPMMGKEWFDAVNDSGRTFNILTPAQRQIDAATKLAEWKDQQAQFARLHV
jgi:hypothetical protein